MPSSTPDDRIRAKVAAESQRNLANNRHAATSRQGGQEQESTPEDRVRAKLQREGATQSSRRQKQRIKAESTPDERYRAKLQSEKKLRDNTTNSNGHLSRKEPGQGPRPSSRAAAAAASRSRQRNQAEGRSRQAATTRQVNNTETPEERLRNKVASSRGLATAREQGGTNARAGALIGSGSGGRRPNDAQALEDRVRQKARGQAASGGAAAANDRSNMGYARTHAENLQDRVRQKAREAEGLDSETIETAAMTTAPTVATRRNNPDVMGSSAPLKSTSKLDPRAAAVGAFSVVETQQQGNGGRQGGRGDRGGRSHNNGRGGRPEREEGDGRGPRIFDGHLPPNQDDSVSFDAASTVATRPESAHRERRDPNPEQGMAPLAVEMETDPKKNLWCGFQKGKVLLVAGIVILAVTGAGIGAAAGTGAFTSSSSSSSTALSPPASSPPLAAVTKGDQCMLNGITGSKYGGADTPVAVSGDIAAVGSYDDGTAGSVTIHERKSNVVWVETATIQPPDGWAGDQFGRSVDMKDDKDVGIVLVVGATYNDSGTIRGCAYVFAPSREGVWVQRTKLIAADRSKSDSSFGVSVAVGFIFDEFLERRIQVLIGEPFGDFYPTGGRSGSVHIWSDSAEGVWKTLAVIRPSDREDGDGFGADVDCASGGRAVVAGFNGLAYTFVQDRDRRSRWSQNSKIELLDDPIVGISGSSVSLYHRTVAVGSGGAVRIFEFGTSTERARLKPDGIAGLAFGKDVALKEDTIVVSAPLVGGGGGVGDAVYVFQRNYDRWSQSERYENSAEARIGSSVAVDGKTVVISSQSGKNGDMAYVAELC